MLAAGALTGLLGLAAAGCGSSTSTSSTGASASHATHTTVPVTHTPHVRLAPADPIVFGPARTTGTLGFTPVVSVRGRSAAWLSRVPGDGEPITLLRFDQSALKLALHAGSVDPGGSGWQYGSSIGPTELHAVVAGFEGGFKFTDGVGGFLSQGRLEKALAPGFASVVTYADGSTDIGAWKSEVPAAGRTVFSVRQNLSPLIDHGQIASTVSTCVIKCWGPTLGGGLASARGALGIDASGRLIYAGGERLTVDALARALLNAGVVRAIELDINPEWVNLYLYGHGAGSGPVKPIPMIPSQPGIPGQLLTPYSRDFFTVVAR